MRIRRQSKTLYLKSLDRLSIVTEDNVEQMVSDAVQNMPAGSYYGYLDITIPASGWTEAEGPSADHNYTCDVAAEGVTADLIPFGGPKLGSCGVANKAEVVSGCETLEGAVRFYSKKIPETDISAFIILLEQGQGEVEAIWHLLTRRRRCWTKCSRRNRKYENRRNKQNGL